MRPEVAPRKMDWAAAKEVLAAEFDTPADRQEAMRRFKTARMAPGSDPTVFFAGLQQLLDRALTTLDGVSRHQLLSDQSVEGVQPAIGVQLRLARATGQLSVEELVRLARELPEAPLATMQSPENRDGSSVEELQTRVDQLTEQLAVVKTESWRHARTSRRYMCEEFGKQIGLNFSYISPFMDASASFIQRPQTLEQAQQHSVSNGFHPNCQQSSSKPITLPCSPSPGQQPRQNVDPVHQPMVFQDISASTSQQQKAEQRLQPSTIDDSLSSVPHNSGGSSHLSTDTTAPSSTVHPGQTVSSEPVSNNVPHSDSNSPVNGVRPSSGIPRLRPSAIPRLVNPRVDDSVHILERASSIGNASPHRTASSCASPCDKPHDGPISLPQTPSGAFTRPFLHITQSPVEPSSPPNNDQHVGSYYADRSRTSSRPANACRVERTASEHPQRPADNESDTSSVSLFLVSAPTTSYTW
ncbi:hypothetical protein T265_08896 [Opisthorchis viverrini]|uniref:Retrotransposon gag domain-containing protein n=1 Tax=Opisthorchis viverrini TaxID=6198 RepID=A0A074Z7L9_OPIVI|nr:hypothetical protein T265_08896 [Opisthorchis viverrini]KER23166.1 hypothetical protein T265_08896 [Opisthorchis viverrini]